MRPRRDATGQIIRDNSGQVQFEVAPMNQNSGISVVIPSHFIFSLLEATEKNGQ